MSDDMDSYLNNEEKRTHNKFNQHERHTIIRNAKLVEGLTEKIRKEFPTMPGQRLAAGQSILFSVVLDYLQILSNERLEERKNRARLSILAQTARIMAMIDSYPDASKFEDFRNLSHDQLRKYFDEEYKKWLI